MKSRRAPERGSSLRPKILIGLGLSILLMAVAANFIAKLLVRHAWIGWLGLAIVLYVALEMIWRGAFEVAARA